MKINNLKAIESSIKYKSQYLDCSKPKIFMNRPENIIISILLYADFYQITHH